MRLSKVVEFTVGDDAQLATSGAPGQQPELSTQTHVNDQADDGVLRFCRSLAREPIRSRPARYTLQPRAAVKILRQLLDSGGRSALQ